MIRKRNEIDLEIKVKRANLELVIDTSVRAEKISEKDIASLNKRLSELAAETCFEDTFEGRIKALEDTAFGKVEEILKELSEATGKDYLPDPTISLGPIGALIKNCWGGRS